MPKTEAPAGKMVRMRLRLHTSVLLAANPRSFGRPSIESAGSIPGEALNPRGEADRRRHKGQAKRAVTPLTQRLNRKFGFASFLKNRTLETGPESVLPTARSRMKYVKGNHRTKAAADRNDKVATKNEALFRLLKRNTCSVRQENARARATLSFRLDSLLTPFNLMCELWNLASFRSSKPKSPSCILVRRTTWQVPNACTDPSRVAEEPGPKSELSGFR